MKTKLCILLAFFVSGIVFSQIDSIQKPGIVQYKIISLNKPNPPHIITGILKFKGKKSLFVYNKIGLDSLRQGKSAKMDKKNGKTTRASISFPSVDEKGILIYRDFKTKKIIFRQTNTFPFFDAYIVYDHWIPIEWTIMEERRDILGYSAQKAIAQFRGRIYTAWFTREIPVPYGPWKIFGLPGLVLEVYDTANVAIFKAEKIICYPCEKTSITIQKPHEKEIKTLRESVYLHDYQGELASVNANKNFGKIHFISSDEPTSLEDVKKHRKQSFEVIYEWEDFPGDTPCPYEKTLVQQAYESVPDSIRREFKEYMENKTAQSLETLPKSIPIEAEEK